MTASEKRPSGVEAYHQPVITPGQTEGQWLVFCQACSTEAGDYVPRCAQADNHPDKWPPRAVYEDEPPERDPSVLAPLGAIGRAINEAIGRSMLLDPALRDLLIRTGNALEGCPMASEKPTSVTGGQLEELVRCECSREWLDPAPEGCMYVFVPCDEPPSCTCYRRGGRGFHAKDCAARPVEKGSS